jgi:hypothetical protein
MIRVPDATGGQWPRSWSPVSQLEAAGSKPETGSSSRGAGGSGGRTGSCDICNAVTDAKAPGCEGKPPCQIKPCPFYCP